VEPGKSAEKEPTLEDDPLCGAAALDGAPEAGPEDPGTMSWDEAGASVSKTIANKRPGK
jgi:hypothetical protein